jgi:hypothetical protein
VIVLIQLNYAIAPRTWGSTTSKPPEGDANAGIGTGGAGNTGN